jgi:predicted CXXCH cytochrome family protein
MLRPRHCIHRYLHVAATVLAIAAGHAVGDAGRIGQTKHNLAVTGKAGAGRGGGDLCGFCHAPHHARGMSALWAKAPAPASYRIYQSSTLDAKPGQPSGASKLCLSCHDGTIAMGYPAGTASGKSSAAYPMSASSLSNLSTDLSDDHPISFAYTSGLAAQDTQLVDPSQLPDGVTLDKDKNVQCTTCHDPHDDRRGSFLTRSDRNGELCIVCHRLDGWLDSAHQRSPATATGSQAEDWPYGTVAENACRNCHRPHAAGGHERLLIHAEEEANCLACHSGQTARADIRREVQKPSAHDPSRYLGVHDPAETSAGGRTHVECSDCHNPHAATATQARSSTYVPIGPTLAKAQGVGASGAPLRVAQYEYEVCFRCHGDVVGSDSARLSRHLVSSGLRQELGPASQSHHPVLDALGGSGSISLDPTLSRGVELRCTDCHNNDSGPGAGGSGPDGPHGSIYDFLLERNYATADPTPESEQAYALCYKCHRRSSILADESFPEHRRHIVEQKTPCAVCHASHGVPAGPGGDHTSLINFQTAVVSAAPGGGVTFRDTGQFEGNCTLRCHGREHDTEAYSQKQPSASKHGTPRARGLRRPR